MFNQLLKITLFTSVWLWLKPRWRGLLAIIVFVLLVNILHREYLDYVSISEDKAMLVWSFVVKWGLIIIGVLLYFLSAALGGKPAQAKTGKTKAGVEASPQTRTDDDDGFNFLREKKTLENRADKLLNREK
jgi:hypothetical protein